MLACLFVLFMLLSYRLLLRVVRTTEQKSKGRVDSLGTYTLNDGRGLSIRQSRLEAFEWLEDYTSPSTRACIMGMYT